MSTSYLFEEQIISEGSEYSERFQIDSKIIQDQFGIIRNLQVQKSPTPVSQTNNWQIPPF